MNVYYILLMGSGFLLVLAIGQLFVPRRTQVNMLLCLLLFVCFIWLVHGIGFRLGLLNIYPHLNKLHVPFLAATGPLWYLYVIVLVTGTYRTKADIKHFVPVLISILLSLPFYLQSELYKREYVETNVIDFGSLFMYLATRVAELATVVYTLLAIYQIRHSRTSSKSKPHIRVVLYCLTTLAVFAALARLVGSVAGNHAISVLVPIAVVLPGFISLYWLSFRHPWLMAIGIRVARLNQASAEGQAQLASFRERIRENGWYLNPDLKILEVARRLGVPAHDLSEIINKESSGNFNAFVNELRIDHARNMLVSGNHSIIDIVHASGFNSQSAFYEQFKRFESVSPAKYRDLNRSKESRSDATEHVS